MLRQEIAQLNRDSFALSQWTNAPMQLEKVAQLNWPSDCLFDLMANHNKWPRIFPWLTDVTIDNSQAIIEDGLGAVRTCDMGNGMVLEEVIVGWQPPNMYAYAGLDQTHPFGMQRHVGVIICEPIDSETTRLRWQHYFNHANSAAMRDQLDSSLSAAMQSLINNCGGFVEATTFYRD